MVSAVAPTSALRIAFVDNAVIVVMTEAIGVAEVAQIDQALVRAADAYPHGVALLLSKADSGTAPNEVRAASAKLIQTHEHHLLGVAVVIERPGMLAAIARNLANAVLLASRTRHGKIFSGLPVAAQWLAERMAQAPGPQPSAEQLLTAAQAMARRGCVLPAMR